MHLTGSLSFVNDWTYFTNSSNPAFENLTTIGPHAGTRQASNTGRILRQRYNHLVNAARPTRFWSCSAQRDVETAKFFADGFFGSSWRSDGLAELEVIPEDEDRGGNTLTPGDTCYNYANDVEYGHDLGYTKLAEWQATFSRPIAERFAKDAVGMKFSPLDVYGMMEMCGFEMLARGSSPWCNIFSKHEWLEFEYARDLLHYYRAGPGNKFAATMGCLWLNATQTLLSNDTSKDVYFSFVHDGDIVPVLATLGIFSEPSGREQLPTNEVATERNWRTSDVVPMGGRLIFERITCETEDRSREEHAVRLFVNDGLIDLTGMNDLVAYHAVEGAVSVKSFQRMVSKRGMELKSFREVCGLSEDAPDRLQFLHQ